MNRVYLPPMLLVAITHTMSLRNLSVTLTTNVPSVGHKIADTTELCIARPPKVLEMPTNSCSNGYKGNLMMWYIMEFCLFRWKL